MINLEYGVLDKRFKIKIIAVLFLLLICFVFLVKTPTAFADKNIEQELNENIENQLDGLNLDKINEIIAEIEDYDLFENGFREKIADIINGKFSEGGTSFLNSVIKLAFSDFTSFIPLYAAIAAIAVLSGIVTGIRPGSFSTTTTDVVFYACYSAIILIVVSGVSAMYDRTYQAVSLIRKTTEVIMPVLLTLMVAVGGNVSAKVYQPAVAMLSGGVMEIIINVVLPLFLISFILSVVSNLSKSVRLDKLSSFFSFVSIWLIGLMFTVFTSFITVQGLTAATVDGISYRAAKYATKSYIPILGGYLSDGFDLILAGSVLIKNAVGVGGLCLLLGVIISPILHVVVFSLGLKLTGALVEPVADSRISGFLHSVSKGMTVLYVSMIAVGFMFLIMVMLAIMTSNRIMG